MNSDTLPFKPDSKTAFIRAGNPSESSTTNLQQLFQVGVEEFKTEDGQLDNDRLLDEIEWFGLNAIYWNLDSADVDHSDVTVQTPAGLALVATYAVIRAKLYDSKKWQENLENGGKNLKPLHWMREYYGYLYIDLLSNRRREFADSVINELATNMYQKERSRGPEYHGPVVSGFGTPPETDERCLKIPIAAASLDVVGFSTDIYQDTEADLSIWDNCIYKPLSEFNDDWFEYLNQEFRSLVRVQEDALTEAKQDLLRERTRIVDEIRMLEQNSPEDVYKSYTPEKRKIYFIKDAVLSYHEPSSKDWFSASQVHEAIQKYSGDNSDASRFQDEFSSQHVLEQFLHEHADDRNIFVDRGSGGDLRYAVRLPHTGSSYKQLHIDHPREIFEQLPCFQNMAQDLRRNGPSRKPLFSFVRLVMWLTTYYDESNSDNKEGTIKIDEVEEDIHETFDELFGWYDREITSREIWDEYQLGEQEHRDTYLALSCNNETMQEHCVGFDNCPYSIYQSLNFTEEMFEKIDNDTGAGDVEDKGF